LFSTLSPQQGERSLPRAANYRTPIDDKALGQRVRESRKRRGLNQTAVASALGIHQTLFSEYERGTVRIPATVLAGLAEILKTPTDQLLDRKPSKENGAVHDRRFIRRLERIDKLPKRAKQALLKTIDAYLAASEKTGTRR
jgi:transcriptional regulator with XRE-family HTH domain